MGLKQELSGEDMDLFGGVFNNVRRRMEQTIRFDEKHGVTYKAPRGQPKGENDWRRLELAEKRVRFRQQVHPAVVLFAEAIMVSVLGTFPRVDYRGFRDGRFSPIDWDTGVNQSDPLMTGDHRNIWKDSLMSKRRKKMDNARDRGGPVRVACTKSPRAQWMLAIFEGLQLYIPQATPHSRGGIYQWFAGQRLVPSIDRRWPPSTTPLLWMLLSILTVDWLGIRGLSKEINGREEEIWLEQKGDRGIRKAQFSI
ncbi:hypothetical protein Q9189_003313 [Teloschistes chrysophthalmus]